MTKIVFFDTDCISSFLWSKSEFLLEHCYGSDMIIPSQVYDEISRVSHLKQRIDDMVTRGNLLIESIAIASEEYTLFLNLTDVDSSLNWPVIGPGEAAAIALVKKNNGILASNNFKDVKYYVKRFGLSHISTPDIMLKAVNDGLITKTQADNIWAIMILKKRKLPFNTFTDYLNSL